MGEPEIETIDVLAIVSCSTFEEVDGTWTLTLKFERLLSLDVAMLLADNLREIIKMNSVSLGEHLRKRRAN